MPMGLGVFFLLREGWLIKGHDIMCDLMKKLVTDYRTPHASIIPRLHFVFHVNSTSNFTETT